jgi:hypothetical protein
LEKEREDTEALTVEECEHDLCKMARMALMDNVEDLNLFALRFSQKHNIDLMKSKLLLGELSSISEARAASHLCLPNFDPKPLQ